MYRSRDWKILSDPLDQEVHHERSGQTICIKYKQNKTKYFIPKFDKNLGCYRLPPLKEISSPRFGEARKKEGFGLPRWLPPLKETFVGSLGDEG
jgi:hypothetical protein